MTPEERAAIEIRDAAYAASVRITSSDDGDRALRDRHALLAALREAEAENTRLREALRADSSGGQVMTEPRTQAGRDLLARIQNLNGRSFPLARAEDILAIEAEAAEQHEAALRARGWQDEHEAATAAAMNFGDGQAEALPSVKRLARVLHEVRVGCPKNWHGSAWHDFSASAVLGALRDEPETER